MSILKIFINALFAVGLFLQFSCNNNENSTKDVEAAPTEVEGNDPQRYNLNAPDEEVIKLDSTTMDSTVIE